MNSHTIIRTESGKEFHTPEYPFDVREKLAAGGMVEFQDCQTPTRAFWINSNSVESVEADPYA